MREPLEDLQLKVGAVRERLIRDFNNWQIYLYDLVIPTVNQTVGALCSSIKERHRVNIADINGPVYCVHYTSLDTLINLLSSSANKGESCLRLYDSWNFNDPDEGSYFMDQTDIQFLGRKLPPYNSVRHAYVTSFILDHENNMSDDLPFWRMYGKEGKGCSMRLSFPMKCLFRVLYGSDQAKKTGEELQQIIEQYRPAIFELLNQIRSVISNELGQEYANTFITKMIDAAFMEELESIKYLYKHENYKYENEVRIVKTFGSIRKGGGNIKFDLDLYRSQGILRHYYEDKDLATNEILVTGSTITLGPCVEDQYTLQFYLRELQRRAGLVGPEIRYSKVSYRKT